MNDLRGWAIYAWVALPTVMYGGYALLALLTAKDEPSSFRRTWFRAGHAHAGVLLMMLLLFLDFMARTELSFGLKQAACAIFLAGLLSQSGGFFVHMARGQPGASSLGTRITSIGALLLTLAIGVLVYGLATASQLG